MDGGCCLEGGGHLYCLAVVGYLYALRQCGADIGVAAHIVGEVRQQGPSGSRLLYNVQSLS